MRLPLRQLALSMAVGEEVEQGLEPGVVADVGHGPGRFGGLVGDSLPMRQLFQLLARVAPRTATVLIEGETGTGKEVTAQALHAHSPRQSGPFVVVDCGAIPGALLESELFGHERGAFTGALVGRVGAFEAAHGGTIFLDEIGELELELQPKILRALENRRIKRVGGQHYLPVDVRVVAATHRRLEEEVAAGRFRADLYYRLAVVRLRVPPLRERLEDLPALLEDILGRLGEVDSGDAVALRRQDTLAELQAHPWPGNVRQLRNYVERRLALGKALPPPGEPAFEQVTFPVEQPFAPKVVGETAEPAEEALGAASEPGPVDPGMARAALALDLPLRDARAVWVATMETQYLQGLLQRYNGNIAAASRAAGVNRAHFYRLLWKRGLRKQKGPLCD